MADEPTVAADGSAVRVALWRALHVEVDPPPHVLHDEVPPSDDSGVVLTTYADDDSVLSTLVAGAAGYLTQDAGRDDIRWAREAAVAGQAVLDPAVQATLLEAARQAPGRPAVPPDGLTDREAEVLTLIAAGLSNTEIAEQQLGVVAEATVKMHVNRIFAKTGSRDRAQAAVYAHRHGMGGADDAPRP